MQTATRTFDLTDSQREQYDRDGFFVTDVVFEPKLTAMLRDEFQRVWNEEVARAEAAKADATALAMLRTRPFLSDLARRSRACADFLRHPVLLDLARQMIGPDADVPWPQAVIKPPSTQLNNSFAWHQDNYYAAHGGYVKNWDRQRLLDLSNGYMCWVAVTRATVANGTLWVLPGKHLEGFLPHTRDPQRGEWVLQADTSAKRAVELEPGQMLVFSGLTPHASGPNTTSDETRMAYQFGFVRPGTSSVPSLVPVMREGRPVP
jgi:ectoine hydroxylase-related dioxygenase (phytanoyl-CoA dioxygenase family)